MAPRSQAAELAALRATLEAFMTHQKERETQFEEMQVKTAAAVSTLQQAQRDIEHKQTRIMERIDQVEPVTSMVMTAKSWMVGALFILGVVGTALITVGKMIWERFMG